MKSNEVEPGRRKVGYNIAVDPVEYLGVVMMAGLCNAPNGLLWILDESEMMEQRK